MKAARSLAVCLAVLPAWSRAQEAAPIAGEREVGAEDGEVARQVRDTLADDPAARGALARRLLASSLAERLSGGRRDPAAAEAEIAAWILANPGDAARLAVGFARDDRAGTREFESSLHERVRRYLALNPDRHKGILGVLGAAGSQSKLVLKLDKKLAEEEQRELIKQLFEGRGSESNKVLTQDEAPGRSGERGGPGAVGFAGAYDRLSELNPSGYSPDVLSLQSALNAQRPPGAPKLVESGRLDYATLAHPVYGLRHHLGRQEGSLKAQRAWELARALGRERELRAEQCSDPSVQAKLEADAKGRAVPARLERRRAALDRARAEVEQFQRAALALRDPASITRAGLRSLSTRQKEAARWLMIADLEGDLHRLESESAFWTPELEGLVRSAPAPEPARRAFLARGGAARTRLAGIRAFDEAALAVLLSQDYAARWSEMERQLAQANALRRGLSRDLLLLTRVPPALHAARRPASGWRAWLEPWVRRFAPSSAWAREAERRERRGSAWLEAFSLVAAGDFDRAQRSAAEAGRD
ncbi:MAG: hypothetical protein HY554_01700 [Elusimicrobia bacterium]|nr:hypothetical protein [Elusimicrobiota bacterium]